MKIWYSVEKESYYANLICMFKMRESSKEWRVIEIDLPVTNIYSPDIYDRKFHKSKFFEGVTSNKKKSGEVWRKILEREGLQDKIFVVYPYMYSTHPLPGLDEMTEYET